MFNKIKKFLEETAVGAKVEIDEEEYLASYDATAGKLLRQEEVKRADEADLGQCACDDPVQKGVLDALSDFEKVKKDAKQAALLSAAGDLLAKSQYYKA